MSEPHMAGRAVINLDALAHNFRVVRAAVGHIKIVAVVKAGAYGHGSVECARTFIRAGADYLGIAQVAEAEVLSDALGSERTVPIFSWIFPQGTDLRAAAARGIEVSVGAGWVLDALEALPAGDAPIRVHLGVDTGMAREGFQPDEVGGASARLKRLQDRGIVRVVGLWSHLAIADDPAGDEVTAGQVTRFEEARRIVREAGLEPEVEHLGASSGALWHPEARYSMVRPGIVLYGLSPNPAVATFAELGLRPAMTLEAPLLLDRHVPAGTGVSYGHTAHTSGAAHLGVVPLGYADGIPRASSNRAEVLVAGKRAPIIGRVCMDQFIVELPDADVAGAITPGENAILFGDPAEHPGVPTADEWADAAGTINYEIVTRIGARVPRVYVHDEK